MAIVSGYNVYPREIDEVLFAHPDVLKAVSAGIPDAHRGETIGVCVSLRAGSNADATTLLAHCQRSLAAYKVPTVFRFMPDIPKTAAGKIDRRATRAVLIDSSKS